jgi:cellulose synthase/poly-beta-1,6-N-acetylglucosamine synthase-like glycosyltransferase
MIFAFQLILLLAVAILSMPVMLFFVQVMLALRSKAMAATVTGTRPGVAVLIPAHNEEVGIGKTLERLRPQLVEGDRLLVLADNCTDNTAAIARNCGAEVCERTDAQRRGKGYALDHGVRFLARNPREVVIIIDADCLAGDGVIDALSRAAFNSNRPVQALNLMVSQTRERLTTRIAEFAWLVKNHVRPLGFYHAGLPCQLMGTGMAFPWSLISTASIANGHLVEDMKLGLDLAEGGHPPLFCPAAVVSSYFPKSTAGMKAQRSRWEHGHVSMILSALPRILLRALSRRNWPLFALAADLMVPPLALLTLLVGVTFLLAAGSYVGTGMRLPLEASAVLIAALFSAVSLSWWKFGRTVIDFVDLCFALVYAAWKLPLYLRFFLKRQVEWIRSERD